MSDYQFDFTNYDREMHTAVRKHIEFHAETDFIDVYIGDGQTPPTVVIPLEKRSHPTASIYCYGTNAETKSLYQVVNSRNLIPNQNVNAGLKAKIAKPPNSDLLHLVEVDLTQTGGIHPIEVRTQQERQITPDRYQEIRLASNGTLIPDFIGGKIRVNGEWKPVPSGTGPDFTSHVPATANKERWVLVGVDPDTGAFDVVDGSDFDLGTANNPESDAPKTNAAGYFPFEVVKLTNGDTATQDTQMLPLSMIPAFSAAGGGGMTSFNLAGTSGTPQAVGDSETATIEAGTGITTTAAATRKVTVAIDSTVATLTGSQTLTNKTLTTPTIGDFTNAGHDHQDADDGGQLNAGSVFNAGQVPLARGGTGADLGATGPGFLKQATSGANVTVAALASGDIPNLDAAKITSGVFDVARIPAQQATRAIKGATQAILAADTQISFSGTDYDDGSWFDNSTDTITVGATGRYSILLYVVISSVIGLGAAIKLNGNVLASNHIGTVGSFYTHAVPVIWEGGLSSSDAITGYARPASSTNLTTACYLVVRRIG